MSAIDYVKHQARILQRTAEAGDPDVIARIGVHEGPIQRRHCLAALAKELGFEGWPHAVQALDPTSTVIDHGTLMYPHPSGAFSNIWFADYPSARKVLDDHAGVLLGYRKQAFIAEGPFLEEQLGLKLGDPDLECVGRDLVRPRDPDAAARLYETLVRYRLAPAA